MSLKIALVQQHASMDIRENLGRGGRAFEEAARAGARLVIFPELAFLPFYPQRPAAGGGLYHAEPVPGPTTARFSKLAREYETAVVLNLYEHDGEKNYDSSPVIDTDGTIVGMTRMQHIMEGPGFHEQGYYHPGDLATFVHKTKVGRIGVAVCYDRHFPEYMRLLRLQEAEIVVIPQAGSVGEWTEGIFEAEVQVAAFQNGYYAALANRVGREERLEFAGESFVADPDGRVIARAPRGRNHILYADCDFSKNLHSHAAKHFLRDRRPEIYSSLSNAD